MTMDRDEILDRLALVLAGCQTNYLSPIVVADRVELQAALVGPGYHSAGTYRLALERALSGASTPVSGPWVAGRSVGAQARSSADVRADAEARARARHPHYFTAQEVLQRHTESPT